MLSSLRGRSGGSCHIQVTYFPCSRTPKGGRARVINQEGPCSRYPSGDLAEFGRAPLLRPPWLARYTGLGNSRVCVCARSTHVYAGGGRERQREPTRVDGTRGELMYVRRAWPGSANRDPSRSPARPLSRCRPRNRRRVKILAAVSNGTESARAGKGISALDLGLHFPSASRARPLSRLRLLLFPAACLSPDQPSSISSPLDFFALHVLVRRSSPPSRKPDETFYRFLFLQHFSLGSGGGKAWKIFAATNVIIYLWTYYLDEKRELRKHPRIIIWRCTPTWGCLYKV